MPRFICINEDEERMDWGMGFGKERQGGLRVLGLGMAILRVQELFHGERGNVKDQKRKDV